LDETDDDMLWSGTKRMGMLGVRVRNMKASTVKTVLLIACVPLGEKSPHYLLNGGLGRSQS